MATIPRFSEPYDARQCYRHRPGAYAVLMREGKILLTYQALAVPEIQLPGGGAKERESLYRTLVREVYEETGWRFQFLRKIGAYRRFTYIREEDGWFEKLCHIYLGRPTLCLGKAPEHDHVPFWCAKEEAPALLSNEGDAEFLRRFLRVLGV